MAEMRQVGKRPMLCTAAEKVKAGKAGKDRGADGLVW
jgi:hypothetical protein